MDSWGHRASLEQEQVHAAQTAQSPGLPLKTGTEIRLPQGPPDRQLHQAGVLQRGSSFPHSHPPGSSTDLILTRPDILQSGTFLENQHWNQGWRDKGWPGAAAGNKSSRLGLREGLVCAQGVQRLPDTQPDLPSTDSKTTEQAFHLPNGNCTPWVRKTFSKVGLHLGLQR